MLRVVRVFVLAFLVIPSATSQSPEELSNEPFVLLPPGIPGPAFPQGPDLWEALADREHGEAADLLGAMDLSTLPGPSVGDHAFVLAWSLIRSDRADEAIPLMSRLDKATGVPADYLALTRAEIQLAMGEPVRAAGTLAAITEDSLLHARSSLVRAKSLRDAGRTRDAYEAYEAIAARPDPSEGSHVALFALAKKKGLSNPNALPFLRRLWAHYPLTSEGKKAKTQLEQQSVRFTQDEKLHRGRSLMRASAWRTIIRFLEPIKGGLAAPTPTNCELAYILGRAYFKKNEVTKAAALLGPVGRRCNSATPDLGPKMLYLAGKSSERKKEWARASTHYLAIPKLYPDHSYADDGYALGGIAANEAGQAEQALNAWTEQVDRYPTGDNAGEAFWRLAWGAYQNDDTPGAIAWAERTLRELPIEVDPEHYRAAGYWAARWRLFPDRSNPRQLTSDSRAREQGLEGLQQVMQAHPTSYYGIQAASRLEELAPNRVARFRRAPRNTQPRAWKVRESFSKSPHIQAGIALSRLGLRQEALSEFRQSPHQELLHSEAAFLAKIRWAGGDSIGAHDALRKFLTRMPPEGFQSSDVDAFLRQAYPQRFYEEVQAATVDYDWDPRIFHALVREESNFNRKIVSWAGARGLSQLMPRTAERVAAWLKVPYSKQRLFEPAYNLAIGSRYFHFLMERYNNNPFLAMAGYNAGEGNVGKWRRRFGDLPTDEWVEMIPIRQTRHYVKRVSGTWQTYHMLYDGGSPLLNLSAYNHDIVPD